MSINAKEDAFVVTTADGSYDIVETNVLGRDTIKIGVDESGSK